MTAHICEFCGHRNDPADSTACASCNSDMDIATRSGWEAEIARTWAHHPVVMAELSQHQAAE